MSEHSYKGILGEAPPPPPDPPPAMDYRSPLYSLHAENAKLRAKIVELESKPAPRYSRAANLAHFGFGMLLIATVVFIRNMGPRAEIVSVVILVGLWALIVRTLRN